MNSHGGKVIQQYPQYGDYLVEVAIGSEHTFLAAMNELNILADLNIVEYPKERYDYFVFDDFADVFGIQHGRKVSSILSSCQSTSVINEINIYSAIPDWLPIVGGAAFNLSRFKFSGLLSQNQILVNWSNGYGDNDADWQSMTEKQKQDFLEGYKKSMKMKLDKIIWLKEKNPSIDIVFAQAAGNERCPKLAQIINDFKSNPQYKTIIEENVIFVSDYSAYANTSSTYGDFCYIKEHPYYYPNGGTTSFATPQALCCINQVINGTIGPDGNNISAVQALAAVKAAIRQNSNGELDVNEALEMARIMYSTSSGFFGGTPFNKVKMTFNGTENIHTTSTYVKRVYDGYDSHGTDMYHYETITGEKNDNLSLHTTVMFEGKHMRHDGDFTCYIGYIYIGTDNWEDEWEVCSLSFNKDYCFTNDSVYPFGLFSSGYKIGNTYHVSYDESENDHLPSWSFFSCADYFSYPYNNEPNLVWNYYYSGDYSLYRYFENSNVFCFRQNVNSNRFHDSPADFHQNYLTNTECIVKFLINPTNNTCKREITETIRNTMTDDYNHYMYYEGIVSITKIVTHTIDGTWERID